MRHREAPRGITVVEVIIVVIIVGLIAALAIPKFSRGATAQNDAQSLRNQVSVLRNAIEMYYYDHAAYPAGKGTGRAAAGSFAAFKQQLTMFSDRDGNVSEERSARFAFGPYLRRGIPGCACGGAEVRNEVVVIEGTARPAYQADQPNAGWVYNMHTGEICANSNGVDAQGTAMDRY
ncbi:MAG: hypothetical protein JNG88_04305 [Phycisphaerales bacterium]|nr:hypothetical protein [Phycisphaerales bacterium]